MEHATAFHMGQTLGILMAFVFMGGMVFFVISLVKAFTTRRPGWIVAASVTGVPVLLLMLFFVVAFALAFTKGVKHAREVVAAKQGQPSALLTAEMTPFTGSLIPYEISIPAESQWTKARDHRPYDYVFNNGIGYFGTIVEGIGLSTPQRVYEMSKKHVMSKASESAVTEPKAVEIDSRDWLTFDVTATVSGAHLKYRYYVYADTNYTVQLISWTGPILFDRYSPVFDRIAKSFKLPK
jgi:hypothetical protein